MIVTYSSLNCFQQCHRKYKLRYLDGIVPIRKSNALEFGSAMHIALEKYWNYVNATQTFLANDADVGACDLRFDATDILKDKVEAAKLTGLLVGYIKEYYDEDVRTWEVIDIEREFKVRVFGNDIVGKADGIVMNKNTGKCYILEHKTASLVDESYVDQKAIDSQTMLYAACLQDIMGITISGAIHDILTKQKIRLKKGESEDDFCQRLIGDVSTDNFNRIIIDFGPTELSDFQRDFYCQIDELYGCRQFYKCTGACIGRYGACEYLPLCKSKCESDEADPNLYEKKKPFEEISNETLEG